jgi:hypothetical protein
MPRFRSEERSSRAYSSASLTDFYREEFVKHRRCLEQQRECFSELAVAEVENALTQVMGRLETLCSRQDCDEVVSELLRKFDVLTGLSAWSDPKTFH